MTEHLDALRASLAPYPWAYTVVVACALVLLAWSMTGHGLTMPLAVGLVLAAYAFAVLFRAHRRDYPWVMAAAITGYLISRFAGLAWGSPVGIFLSALTLTAAGNAFARWANRPGALIRVPGILMLVPGSTSLRGLLTLVQQQDMSAGQTVLMTVLNVVMALVAGLLFGNLLMPARKTL